MATEDPSPPARRSRRAIRLTERDRMLLVFISQHRLILVAHAETLLGVSRRTAAGRLAGLTGEGLITRDVPRFHHGPGSYRIASTGLRTIGSRLPVPRFDLAAFDHDVGLAWVHLAALGGRFGPVREAISEREMRARDARPERRALPLGVRLGGLGPGGRERLHYPDLLLRTRSGHTIAIELELTSKGRTRLERVLGAYTLEPRIDAVVYLSDQPAVQRAVQTSARRLGISTLVHVQRFAWGESGRPSEGRTVARDPGRRPPELGR